MPERSVAIQLELPADPDRPLPGSSVSELQLDRAQHKPLVASRAFPEYGLTELASDMPGRVRLRRRPDSRFADGELVAVDELVSALIRGFETQPNLCDLFGLRVLSGREVGGDAWIELECSARVDLVQQLLSGPAFRVRRARVNATNQTGPFGIASTVPLRLTGSKVELRLPAVHDAARIVDDFNRGALDLTCPTCFELSEREKAHPAWRSCEPDLDAYLLINPQLAPRLADPTARAWLQQEIASPGFIENPAVVPMPSPEFARALRPRAGTCHGLDLRLVYSEYWPNREIAKAVASAIMRLGAKRVELAAVPLETLSNEVVEGRAGAALQLRLGMFGRERSMALRCAVLAMRLTTADQKARLKASMVPWLLNGAPPEDSSLALLLHALVPVLPVCRFRSGFLARSGFEGARLVNDNYFALEQIA